MVIDWDNLRLLFTASYYKQEYFITCRSDPKPKSRKSTKAHQPKISIKVHPAPEESTRFHQPENSTEFHWRKISTDVYWESEIPVEPHELTPSIMLPQAKQKLKLTTRKYKKN